MPRGGVCAYFRRHDAPRALVEDRRRLPDLPAQLRRLRRRRHRRPARASSSRLDYLADARRRRRLAVAGLPLAAGRQRLRHQRLPGHRPAVRHAGRLRRAARGAARARHEAGHGPRGQPHLRRAPVVRRVALVAGQPEARLVLVAAAARRAWRRATRAPSRPTGGRSSPARPGSSTRRPASTTCTCSRRKQPDLNWENPEVRAGGLRDDALVARPRGRRLPHGRHQHDLQGPGAARRAPSPTGARSATAAPYFICGPRIHEFLQEMHREVFAGRDGRAAHRRRDARRDRRARRGCSPTRPAREVDMVFQFEHVGLDQGATQVGRRGRCGCATSRRRSAAGRPGWPTSAGTACTGTTTTSRGRCRGSATTASTACASAKMLGHGAAPAPRHAVRLPGRGARHDERAVRARSTTSATSSRSTTTREAVAAGRRPGRRCWPALRDDEPRQRPHADAVGRVAARRLHHRRRRGSRSTRTTPRSTPRPQRRRPGLGASTTTGG